MESAAQFADQGFQIAGQDGVVGLQGFDPANGVQHRRVIAAPEAPAYVGQRPRGQLLGQPHGRLARPGDRAVAALGDQVGLLEAKVLAGGLLDIIDRDAFFTAAQVRAQDDGGVLQAQLGQRTSALLALRCILLEGKRACKRVVRGLRL